jgi:hypothetical protein
MPAEGQPNGPATRGRGRIGRGRPSRARGRARGSFRFPASNLSTEYRDSVGDSEGAGQTAPTSLDGGQAISRNAEDRRSSTSSSGLVSSSDHASRLVARQKELPPHIAGVAVDADSLVSRVRELAINGHAHTSSMESRSTSRTLNWADEEDEPDSLPDLDDWVVGSKAADTSLEIPSEPNDAINTTNPDVIDTVPIQEPQVEEVQDETSKNPQLPPPSANKEAVDNTVQNVSTREEPRTRPFVGTEASIWANAPSPPRKTNPKPRNERHGNTRGHVRHASDRPIPGPPPRSEPLSNQEPTPVGSRTAARKPHARPVITSDALARISRTLGHDALRPSPAATTSN